MGSMTLLGVGRPASTALPGPPSFTAQTTGAFKNFSGSTPTFSATLDIGAAFTGRLVVAMFYTITNANITAADFGGVGASLVTLADDATTNTKWRLVYGIVNAGTTVVMNITADDTFFGNNIAVWTADSASFVSTTPVTAFNVALTTPPVTTQVNTVSGGAVLALMAASGGSLISPAFSAPNDPSVASDFSNGFQLAGHANNSAAFSPANVTVTATGSGTALLLALAAFR